jgi:hypothetical protein
MAEWRARGYVPDSDDEDSDGEPGDNLTTSTHQQALLRQPNFFEHRQPDDDSSHALEDPDSEDDPNPADVPSSPSQVSSVKRSASIVAEHLDFDALGANAELSLPDKESSTAEKLEGDLSQGLKTCREVLSPTNSPILDIDSPLSSLPSSPATPTHELAKTLVNARADGQSEEAVDVGPARRVAAPPLVPAGRSLRPRALMQLHPFTIEFAKHQKDWNARGMRPVRLSNATGNSEARPVEETQSSDALRSSQNDESSQPHSSLPADPLVFEEDESQSPQPRTRSIPRSPGLDDELPDLADIFSGRALSPSKPMASTKRCRPDSSKGSVHRKRLKLLDLPFDLTHDNDRSPSRDNTFDFPLSPPRSISASSSADPRLELSIGRHQDITPKTMPTPILSSEHQVAGKVVVEVSSSSEESDQESGSSTDSPSEAEAEDSGGLFQIRKRIKGVLPASWVKLDARQQQRPTIHRSSTSPEKSHGDIGKGLAKHIASFGMPPSGSLERLWPLDFGSAEEDSDASVVVDGSVRGSHRATPGQPDADEMVLEGDEVEVEDEVDAMLPVATRAPYKQSKPFKKRQRRLDDSWIVDDHPRSVSTAQRSTKRRAINHANPRDKKRSKSELVRKKSRARQLTVLDAPGFTCEEEGELPQFLKVAARCQVSNRRSIAQNPQQKFFQLSTKEDTEHINQQLRDWTSKSRSRRRGSRSYVPQLANSEMIARPKSGNFQQNSSVQIRKLKASTEQTLERLHSTSARAAVDSVEPSLSHSSDHPPLQRLGLFYARVNRSGRGKLLDPVISRTAQLESPRASTRPIKHSIRAPRATDKLSLSTGDSTTSRHLPRSERPKLPQSAYVDLLTYRSMTS